jgi:hypothetical protein
MVDHASAQSCGCDAGVTPPWVCERHRKQYQPSHADGGWIGVDLDGTLAIYPHSFPEIGPPIAAMVEQVRGWIAEGQDVRIFTARVCRVPGLRSDHGEDDDAFADNQLEKIARWSHEHLGMILPVTCVKDFKMIVCYDDRCVQMITNTGESLDDRWKRDLRACAQSLVAILQEEEPT